MNLDEANRIVNGEQPAKDKEEWLDAYLTVQIDLHEKLRQTLEAGYSGATNVPRPGSP